MARRKNLLADTDYTKGHDNRFQNAVSIGYVSKVEVNETQANVRVIYPDRVDHKGQPLITKPIPVLQVASQAKKSFAVPRVGDMVCVQKMANGLSSYLVTGSFFTTANPPPVIDPMLDYCIYDDGSTKQFDANSGTETNKLKGDVNWDNQGGALLKFVKDAEIDSQGNITLKATKLIIQADIQHTGGMTTTGIHTAADGPHASCGLAQGALEERLAAIEQRLAALDGQTAPPPSTEEKGCC